MRQLAQAQPVEQLAGVLGEQHALQVLIDLALFVRRAFADRQQRQVVVAEHHDAALAQRMHQPQRLQRLPATVDQVAAEPKRVGGRVEADLFQ